MVSDYVIPDLFRPVFLLVLLYDHDLTRFSGDLTSSFIQYFAINDRSLSITFWFKHILFSL